MAKESISFEDFLAALPPQLVEYATQTDSYLQQNNCTLKIESAKNGYVVSYFHKPSGRTLLNYVFRKKGVLMRLYADNVLKYMDYLETLPQTMQKDIEKAPVCKRLINPDACNPRCPKGYEFLLAGQQHQKCRYNCFMFLINEESMPHLQTILQKEIALRAG